MSAIKTYANNTGAKLTFTSVITSETAVFYAFLTNYNESFASSWTEEKVFGRNDPIGTFQGVTRKISLGWDIPAANAEVAQDNMKQISQLTKMLYPSYASSRTTVSSGSGGDATTVSVGSNALTMAKAPLIRLKFANLITQPTGGALLGYITGYTMTPVLDMGMFTMDGNILPKIYTLSVEFAVLHEHDLGANQLKSVPFPFTGTDRKK